MKHNINFKSWYIALVSEIISEDNKKLLDCPEKNATLAKWSGDFIAFELFVTGNQQEVNILRNRISQLIEKEMNFIDYANSYKYFSINSIIYLNLWIKKWTTFYFNYSLF